MHHHAKPGIKIPRPRRIKFMNPNDGYYHIVSRALQKEMRFGEQEKQKFLALLKWLAKVYFVRIATFCILDNHVHIVLKMIPSDTVSLSNLERRLLLYYENGGPPKNMEEAFEQGDVADYYAHFSDISMFMWDLKLRFARWYNKVHQGYGHVWAERFTSVLLVGNFALRACMIYVELNAVRAGIVEHPEDYPYCGVAHLLRGGRHASWLDRQLLKKAVICHRFGHTDSDNPETPVHLYKQAIYDAGMQKEQPENLGRSETYFSDYMDEGIGCRITKDAKPTVFMHRIEAMTQGEYIDDLGVCNDLFPSWWDDYQRRSKPSKQVLTLPNGIPVDQLITLLNRSPDSSYST